MTTFIISLPRKWSKAVVVGGGALPSWSWWAFLAEGGDFLARRGKVAKSCRLQLNFASLSLSSRVMERKSSASQVHVHIHELITAR
jgi:hypothetical protein